MTTLDDFARYDEMPYKSNPFHDTHPARLAAIAQIFGLKPPPIESARVLEMGCASGGNLTPLAFYYPSIQLVGVDYSQVQINEGIETIKQLGLTNVVLKHMSITDIGADFGLFDYIICHGVYSWVPDEVQDAILRVCHNNLAENGIAYISYNVYPGWKTHEIARDAMLFHAQKITKNPVEQVAHGRGMIEYMRDMSAQGSMFRQIMNHEAQLIQNAEPYYIAHEFFETHNSPCYFHEFNRRAQAHGLSYLSDTQVSSMFVENLGEEHKQRLINASGGDQVMLEQYLDFINNRTFRQTLLIKNKIAQNLNRTINPENLKSITYQCQSQRIDNPNQPAGSQTFENRQKRVVTAQSPTHISALSVLSESFPNLLTYEDLVIKVKEKIANQFNEHELLSLFERLLIVAYFQPWSGSSSHQYLTQSDATPEQPQVNPLVAQHATITGHLTSPLFQIMPSNPVLNVLLPLLDGKNNIEQLEEALSLAVKNQTIHFLHHGTQEPLTNPNEIKSEVRIYVKNSIAYLKNNGYLTDVTQFASSEAP